MPFSGKAVFCRELASSLANICGDYPWEFGLYLPKEYLQDFLPGLPRVQFHHRHKRFFSGRGIELFHSTTPLSPFYPRPFHCRTLTTIHDLNYLYVNSGRKEYEWHDSRTAAAIKRSERLVAISESAKKDVLEHFGDVGKPIDVIYNGVDRYDGPLMAPTSAPDAPFIYCVCRITRSKNLQTLPALLCGNDYRLVISGRDMEDGHLQEIMDAARKLGVDDRLIYTGPVSESEKHWYLSNCAAFAFPSLSEGFGLPVLEALQYHKPIFCSGIDALREVGRDCTFYFKDGFEPSEMQSVFESGITEFAGGSIPSEKIDALLNIFSWDNAARQYFNVYKQMLI